LAISAKFNPADLRKNIMSITANTASFIQSAHDKGVLSELSLAAFQIPNIGAAINNVIENKSKANTSEAVHIIMLVDDSGSIKYSWDGNQYVDNSQFVCDGHNLVIEYFRSLKFHDDIFITTLLLNGKVINAFTHIDDAKILENGVNYIAKGRTPLYDQSVVAIGSAVAKAQELADDGILCRSVVLIATDGIDEHSKSSCVNSVNSIMRDVLQTEQYIVAGMGISGSRNGESGFDFRDIFKKMGIQDRWILTPGGSEKEIRAAFQLFCQSAAKAIQNTGTFSKKTMGGFV
jgi:hypothetical protein